LLKGAPRRLLFALLALAAALGLAACGSSSSSSDSGSSGSGGDQFTTAAFQKTLDAVKDDVGQDAELLEVGINSAGTDYKIRSGEQASGLHFDPGSSDGQDVKVDLIGAGSVADSAFPISEVDPAAIDKMLAAAPAAIGADDFTVTVMTLGRTFSVSGDVQWSINGDAAGRTALVLQAKPDGSGLTAPGGTVPGGSGSSSGSGTSSTGSGSGASDTPPGNSATGGTDPAAIAECVQKAGSDIEKIKACAGQ
jgi:hypothetical protein